MFCYHYCPHDWRVLYSNIALKDDPILREKCYPIPSTAIDCTETHQLIDHLVNIMRKYELVGISAPQIGIPLRIIAMEFPEHLLQNISPDLRTAKEMNILPLTIAINPLLYIKDGKQIILEEKCASIPGYLTNVPRFEEVVLVASNQFGWNARIAQHEIDHLDGLLLTDIIHPPSSMEISNFYNLK